jgi:hypothetical protein
MHSRIASPHGAWLAAPTSRRRCAAVGVALGLVAAGAAPASACDWLSPCAGPAYGYRSSGYVYGSPAWSYRYASPTSRYRAYGYRNGYRRYGYASWYGSPWYGYDDTTPGWAYGYVYATRPSATLPPSEWYVDSALMVPNSASVGLTAPISSAPGLLESGLPARGPSLFGPSPPPPAWGYRYGHYYRPPSLYGYPSYGYRPAYSYYVPSAYTPPRETASWWLEPRRRR